MVWIGKGHYSWKGVKHMHLKQGLGLQVLWMFVIHGILSCTDGSECTE